MNRRALQTSWISKRALRDLRVKGRSAALPPLLLGMAVLSPLSAHAATFTVTDGADDGSGLTAGTLSWAIAEANSDPGSTGTIVLQPSRIESGTGWEPLLQGTQLEAAGDVTIAGDLDATDGIEKTGAGVVTISGGAIDVGLALDAGGMDLGGAYVSAFGGLDGSNGEGDYSGAPGSAGSYGGSAVIAQSGTSLSLSAGGVISGGYGGIGGNGAVGYLGGAGGAGGSGGPGFLGDAHTSLRNAGEIAGGDAGDGGDGGGGYYGGAGGAGGTGGPGVFVYRSSTFENSGQVRGGYGGYGGFGGYGAGTNGREGAGGAGGMGLGAIYGYAQIANSGTITGGPGGDGDTGGTGGIGGSIFDGAEITNSGTIAGGYGGTGYTGGTGGIGLLLKESQLTNTATIAGGRGGYGVHGGNGGQGVMLDGGSNFVNDGTVQGGDGGGSTDRSASPGGLGGAGLWAVSSAIENSGRLSGGNSAPGGDGETGAAGAAGTDGGVGNGLSDPKAVVEAMNHGDVSTFINGSGVVGVQLEFHNRLGATVSGGNGGSGGAGGAGGDGVAAYADTSGGYGGRGGNGGDGAGGGTGLMGLESSVGNAGAIDGGAGGDGGDGGRGGRGGDGSDLAAAGRGGAGGNGGAGGFGGIGLVGTAKSGTGLSNANRVTGGRGGTGGAGGAGGLASAFGYSGAGGHGGAGGVGGTAAGIMAPTSGPAFTNAAGAALTGGVGGRGGDGGSSSDVTSGYAGGAGGAGGIGLAIFGGSFVNDGAIAGSEGGRGGAGGAGFYYGGAGGAGGPGGVGFLSNGGLGRLTNTGTIIGGDGGSGGTGGSGTYAGANGAPGAGGPGVASFGNLYVDNRGLITGGSGDGGNGAQGDAVLFSGGGNTLEIEPGSTLVGNAVSTSGTTGGGDTLTLGGDAEPAAGNHFDTSHIGAVDSAAQFQGFAHFEKSGANTWTLTGQGNQSWTITGGTLAGDTLSLTGDLTFAPSFDFSTKAVFNQAFDGIYPGAITGDGALFKSGDGAVTLTGTESYTGGTTIDGGMLRLGRAASALPATGGLVIHAGTFDLNSFNQTLSAFSGDGAVALGAGGSLVVDQSASTSFDGVISGDGRFTKRGVGTLILNGVNTYTGGSWVDGGILEIGDADHPSARLTGDVTVDAGGTLRGHGTITGAVSNNAGTVQPGGSIGDLTVNGDFTQAPGSTLQIEVAPPHAISHLNVSGTATLGGTLDVIYAPGVYDSDSWQVLNAAAVNGSFASVHNSSGGAHPVVTVAGHSVSLGIDSLVVEPMHNSVLTALSTAAMLNARRANDPLNGPAAIGWDRTALRLSGFSHDAQLAVSGAAAGFTAHAGGSWLELGGRRAGGGAWRLTPGFSRTQVEQADGESGTLTTQRIVLGGQLKHGRWRLDGSAGLASDQIAAARSITSIKETAASRHLASEFSLAAAAHSDFALNGWTLTPVVGLGYVSLREDGYGETGANAFDLTVSASTWQSLQAYVGAQLAKTAQVGGWRWTPKLRIGYRDELLLPAPVRHVQVGGGTFALEQLTPAHGQLSLGLGVEVALGDHLGLYADYSALWGGADQSGRNLTAGLKISF